MKAMCVCGCGERAVQLHHVVYQQEIKRAASRLGVRGQGRRWLRDERNLIAVAHLCHGNHHSASRRYPLTVLPDSVFEFAVEVLGAGKAFNFLARRYAGEDPRLDALLIVRGGEMLHPDDVLREGRAW